MFTFQTSSSLRKSSNPLVKGLPHRPCHPNTMTRVTTKTGNARSLLQPLPLLLVAVAVMLATTTVTVAALDCVQCGEYNDDGVGAITPCLNYSDAISHRYLKRCPRKSHKFCIVSVNGNRGGVLEVASFGKCSHLASSIHSPMNRILASKLRLLILKQM